jgi:hypothetical protein
VSVDLRAAISAALDVSAPPPCHEEILSRAALRRVQHRRGRARSMLAAATLVVAAAIFAGGYASVDAAPAPAHLAALPAPAPVPLAT